MRALVLEAERGTGPGSKVEHTKLAKRKWAHVPEEASRSADARTKGALLGSKLLKHRYYRDY